MHRAFIDNPNTPSLDVGIPHGGTVCVLFLSSASRGLSLFLLAYICSSADQARYLSIRHYSAASPSYRIFDSGIYIWGCWRVVRERVGAERYYGTYNVVMLCDDVGLWARVGPASFEILQIRCSADIFTTYKAMFYFDIIVARNCWNYCR